MEPYSHERFRPIPVYLRGAGVASGKYHDLIARTNSALREVILALGARIRSGDLPRMPQDHSRATYWPKRTPADGLIDWGASTDTIYRLIRAAGRPYPGIGEGPAEL